MISRASEWFDDVPVIGKMGPEEVAERLREAGEVKAAAEVEKAQTLEAASLGGGWKWPWQDKPWQHTSHAFGFLAAGEAGDQLREIKHAGNIAPDVNLKNGRIKITLDRLRVAGYPGGGEHEVLFDFYARHQAEGNREEHLHFNLTGRVKDGQQMAVIGYPIFVGLKVGSEGVAFKGFTVNVQNKQDKDFLSFLDSDAFKGGLKLATVAQPALGLLSEMALGITKSFARRNDNQPVQDFYMGLDFGRNLAGARLKEGSYIAVQIPESFAAIWDWEEWVFKPSNGQIVKKAEPTKLIPYNYVVFGVSKYEGD